MTRRLTRAGAALGAALAAGWGVPRAAAETPPAPPATAAVERLIAIPSGELKLLLEGHSDRVLLPREEYERLKAKARRADAERAPAGAVVSRVDFSVAVEEDRAVVTGEVHVEVLAPGLQEVKLDLGPLALRHAMLDRQPAALGGADGGGGVSLFLEGLGRRVLRLDGTVRVTAGAARQELALALPDAGATRLSLVVPGDVELKSGAEVVRRAFDEAAGRTRFELLPPRGAFALALTLNSRQKRTDAVVSASSVQVSSVGAVYEELVANVQVEIRHFGLKTLPFDLPPGLEITDVTSPQAASWKVDATNRVLDVVLRDDQPGTVSLTVRGLRPRSADGSWSMPVLRPRGAAAHAALLGLRLESRAEAEEGAVRGLIPVDHDLLRLALPETFAPRAGGEQFQTAGVWFAPHGEGEWTARLVRPPAAARATSHLLLTLTPRGIGVRGALTLVPDRERTFRLGFILPSGWEARGVTAPDGKALAFESYSLTGGERRIVVPWPAGAARGEPMAILFEAETVPADWFNAWASRRITVPAVRVEDAQRQEGSLVLDAREDLAVRAAALRGLKPMDEREKQAAGLGGEAGLPAYRYDALPAEAEVDVRRLVPRLGAESYLFARVEPGRLVLRAEVRYTIHEAGARTLRLALPATVPSQIAITGVGETGVKDYRGEETNGVRVYTVELQQRAAQEAHLVAEWQQPLTGTNEAEALPWVRAEDVAYHAGRICIEGHADLEVEVRGAPRRVDVGELVDAAYEPGARILGVFAFAGEPPPVSLRIGRPAGKAVPAAIAESARISTAISPLGVSQSRAEFVLRTKADFIELRLPEGATFWSALFAGEPVRPSRRGGTMLFDLRQSEQAGRTFEVFYELPSGRLGLTGRVRQAAPALYLPDRGGGPAAPIPVMDFAWDLYAPEDYDYLSHAGNVVPAFGGQPEPAGLRVARVAWKATGGAGFERGLLGLVLTPLRSASIRGKLAASSRTDEYTVETAAPAAAPADSLGALTLDQSDMEPQEREKGQRGAELLTEENARLMALSEEIRRQAGPRPPAKTPAKKKAEIAAWMEQGIRGLSIQLLEEGRALDFRSLGETPVLDVRLVNDRSRRWLGVAFGFAVFALGLRRGPAPLRRKVAYVLGAIVLLTAVAALPAARGWAAVLDAGVYAAALLVPFYMARWVAVRVWAGVSGLARRIAAAAALALLASIGLARAEDAAEERPQPVLAPADAIILPYDAAGDPASARHALVPYATYLEWLTKTGDPSAPEPTNLPAAFAFADAAYQAELGTQDALRVSGRLAVDVYAAGPVRIPLRVGGGVAVRVLWDGRPASVGQAPPPMLQMRAEAQQQAQIPQQEKRPPAPALWIVAEGKGRHTVDVELQYPVGRQGGWRMVRGVLPGGPAVALGARAPASNEIVSAAAQDRPRTLTGPAPETVEIAPGADGAFDLRWRPRLAQAEIDRSLTADSYAVLDLSEDAVRFHADLRFAFRGGERSFVDLALPAGFRIEQIAGPNVKGWEHAAGEGRVVRVNLLKPADAEVQVRVTLAQTAPTSFPSRLSLPVVGSPEAARHAGRLVVRASPWLEVRSTPGEGLRRADLDVARLERAAADFRGVSPFGLRPREEYAFAQSTYRGEIELRAVAPRVRVREETVLRIDADRDRVEARLRVRSLARPVHALSVRLPPGLDVERVECAAPLAWHEEGAGSNRTLAVAFRSGQTGEVSLVVEGRRERAAGEALAVPRLLVAGAEEQETVVAVQAGDDYDVAARRLDGGEAVLLQTLQPWLNEKQRAATRLGIRFKDASGRGELALSRRAARIGADVFSNIRVTDRAVEETHLVNFRIEQAGARRLAFTLPARLAGARIEAPLLREKTVAPAADTNLVDVTLDLVDSVGGEYRVLVQDDRALSAGAQTFRLPQVAADEAGRRLVAVEGAGRDEIEIEVSGGLEAVSPQQRDWARVAEIFGGAASRVYAAAAATDPEVRLTPRPRQAVETAGARIGLAELTVVADEAGAYRARQVYRMDNRTEQMLEVDLPEGSALLSARVAGMPVKPATAPGRPGAVRLPLVKTSAGDLDYEIVLVCAGRMVPPGLARSARFPAFTTRNVNVELSQTQLRLPRTLAWYDFGGPMERLGAAGQLQAGYLKYQNEKAEQLLQVLKFGQSFEKARALKNIEQLEAGINYQLQQADVDYDSSEMEQGKARQVLSEVANLKGQAAQQITNAQEGNRARLNWYYDNQSNTRASGIAVDVRNFDMPVESAPSAGKAGAARADASGKLAAAGEAGGDVGGWLLYNGLVVTSPDGTRAPAGSKPSPAEKPASLSKMGEDFADDGRLRTLGDLEKQAKEGDKLVMKGLYGNRAAAGRQAADNTSQAAKYQERYSRAQGGIGGGQGQQTGYGLGLERNAAVQIENQPAGQAPGVVTAPARPTTPPPPVTVAAGTTILNVNGAAAPQQALNLDGYSIGGVVGGQAATGLMSLEADLPPDDPARWATFAFRAPRAGGAVTARAVPQDLLESLRRAGLALLLAGVVFLVLSLLARVQVSPARTIRVANVVILLSLVGLLVGVMPLAALVALIAALVVRVSRRRHA